MPLPNEVVELESRGLGSNGEPTFAAAWTILSREWERGDRDREVALHLLFLSWYVLVEPSNLTGYDEVGISHTVPAKQFSEVLAHFREDILEDAEMLYAVGLMATLFPYVLGDETFWARTGNEYLRRFADLAPDGIDPKVFEGRGAYGEYFAHQSRRAGA